MAEVAFLVPIDMIRHARFTKNIEGLQSPHTVVFAVLTRQSDLELWEANSSPSSSVRPIVLSQFVSEEAIIEAEKRNSMPTFKKWCALRQVEDFRYIICCDSEINVVRPIDNQFVDSLPSQFIFFGDHLPEGSGYNVYRKLLAQCQARVPPHESECGNRIYTWWSGLPVYAGGDSLRLFLTTVGAYEPVGLAKSLNREVFDHIVYQHFLCSCGLHGAKFVCSRHDCGINFGWSLEDTAPEAAFVAAETAGLITLWMSKEAVLRLPKRNIYIEYHLDHHERA